MRKIPFAVVLLTVAVSLGAQEARVISLKSTDANHARCTYERLQAAQKEWAAVREDIRENYTLVPEGDKDASNTVLSIQGGTSHTFRRGWESGFEFSSDFKFIVPSRVGTTVGPSSCNGTLWYGNCLQISPGAMRSN